MLRKEDASVCHRLSLSPTARLGLFGPCLRRNPATSRWSL